MFDALITFFQGWFAWIKDTVQGIWTRGSGAVTWALGWWATLIVVFVGLITNSKDAWTQVSTYLAGITAPSIGVAPQVVISWLAVGNTVFPLAETLAYIVAWFALFVACKVAGGFIKLIRGIFT